jgi:hypothetical protein
MKFLLAWTISSAEFNRREWTIMPVRLQNHVPQAEHDQ